MSDGGSPLGIDDLARLRAKTEAVAKLARAQLAAQLEALRPVLAPRRVLGRHVSGGARDDVPGADRALAKLRERFAAACGRPFGLPKELDDTPLSIEALVDVHPFEYRHTLNGDGRVITVTDPMRWVIGYRAGYSLAQLEAALENRANLRPADARQFLVNALAIELLLESLPEIGELLRDLRYEVAIEKRPATGDLPLVSLRSAIPAFRPPDELIAKAIQLSGVPAFIELVDLEGIERIADPLRRRVEAALKEQS